MSGRVWIFDLDNTLHNATPHIFPHINRSMTAYLQEHLKLSAKEANDLRVDYWQRYGATLSGLMKHHGTDPDHFLWHTHQFPRLHDMVLLEPRLRWALQRLPGRKLVYSNAPVHYARAVLKLMRVEDLFDDVFAIEHARYRPKPETAGFRSLLRKHRLHASECVMVEDSAENLRTAKRLGMRTVWVSRALRTPYFVDVKISDVLELPRVMNKF
ncbi:MAG: pyrimidine 5'-nucleotidase [Gammaproteobacteria bacterium]|nr:pyrimidine 5'-nucleotidase [Gammaproteobacteria bacterium]MDD2929843.1 pyrimidine 5'-nucleotidase [Sideroxydans sp.]MDD5471222.1 pyrimidine 5'-nucleotidase [Sideroxydans sp.]